MKKIVCLLFLGITYIVCGLAVLGTAVEIWFESNHYSLLKIPIIVFYFLLFYTLFKVTTTLLEHKFDCELNLKFNENKPLKFIGCCFLAYTLFALALAIVRPIIMFPESKSIISSLGVIAFILFAFFIMAKLLIGIIGNQHKKESIENEKINETIISETNDTYNISLTGDYSDELVMIWLGYQRSGFEINFKVDSTKQKTNEFSQDIVATSERVLRAVFEEWSRYRTTESSFEEMKKSSEERANGSYETFPILENYLYYLTYSMFDLIEYCSDEVKPRSGKILELYGEGESIEHLMSRRKIDDGILDKKIYFFLLTVLYLGTPAIRLKGEEAIEEKEELIENHEENELSNALLAEIEKLEQVISQKEEENINLHKANLHNKNLKRELEEAIEDIQHSDSNYIKTINSLIERAEGRLSA